MWLRISAKLKPSQAAFAGIGSAENERNVVGLEHRIDGNQRQAFVARLGDQHAVEGIAVTQRQCAGGERVLRDDR